MDSEVTPDEYRTHLKVCEFLDKPPSGIFSAFHSFLDDMFEKFYFVTNEHGKVVIYENKEIYITMDYLGTHTNFTCSVQFTTVLGKIILPDKNNLNFEDRNLMCEFLHIYTENRLSTIIVGYNRYSLSNSWTDDTVSKLINEIGTSSHIPVRIPVPTHMTISSV